MKPLARNRFAVKAFHKAMKLANWIQNIPARVTPPPFRLMQLGSAFWQSRALYVATRLGLADILGDRQMSTDEIASRHSLHADYLYRLMRMLASIGIFEETAPRVFRNSKTSHYLREEHPKNVRAMILMHNSPEMSQPWMESLETSIRSGEIPFVATHGKELFSYMDEHQEFDLLFSQAMDSVESLTGDSYLDDFNWSAFRRLVDIGGSMGQKTLSILKRVPALTALVHDREQVIKTAKTYWQGKIDDSILGRVSFEASDMFETIPTAESDDDLYMFFAIFHGMSDKQGQQILKNLKTAFGEHRPCMLIVDTIAEEKNIDPTIASFDMQMLMGTRGRERTLAEWRALLNSENFDIVEVVTVRTFASFIVARLREQ